MIKKHLALFAVILIVSIYSCSSKSEESCYNISDTIQSLIKTADDSVDTEQIQAPSQRFADGLELFANMEFIPYCIALPTFSYEKLADEESEKAQHMFVHKTNRESTITVKGLMRQDSSVDSETYFKNSLQEIKSTSHSIDKSVSFNNNMGLYTKYHELKNKNNFHLNMIWLRSEEVVTLHAIYPAADTAQWNIWITSMITVNSECD